MGAPSSPLHAEPRVALGEEARAEVVYKAPPRGVASTRGAT